jgi:hypothetical protein
LIRASKSLLALDALLEEGTLTETPPALPEEPVLVPGPAFEPEAEPEPELASDVVPADVEAVVPADVAETGGLTLMVPFAGLAPAAMVPDRVRAVRRDRVRQGAS